MRASSRTRTSTRGSRPPTASCSPTARPGPRARSPARSGWERRHWSRTRAGSPSRRGPTTSCSRRRRPWPSCSSTPCPPGPRSRTRGTMRYRLPDMRGGATRSREGRSGRRRTALPWLLASIALTLGACTSPEPEAVAHRSPESSSAVATTASPSPSPVSYPPLEVRPRATLPPAEQGLPTLTSHVLTEANYPAGLAVAPDGRIFYTELFAGSIRVIERDGTVTEWYDVNEHFGIQWTQFYHGGLTAITIDPDFESNHFVFAVTQVPSKKTGFAEKSLILRFKERNGHGTDPKVLLELPASQFDNLYSLVFAPDGTLYVPSGNESMPGVRDVPGDLVGEILHITRDGEAVPGGPFGEKAPMTYAYGIRNSFDLAIEPGTGYLIGGENSTEGNDE